MVAVAKALLRASGTRRIFMTRPGGLAVRSLWRFAFMAALIFSEPGFAQKLVDPNIVAPEFREAAEKRRAEQIRTMECHHKADAAKVLPRGQAPFSHFFMKLVLAAPARGLPS